MTILETYAFFRLWTISWNMILRPTYLDTDTNSKSHIITSISEKKSFGVSKDGTFEFHGAEISWAS